MKRNLLALAALAAIAGSAQAAPLDRAGAAAATNKLYVSGSSALQKLVEGMVSQNCDADGMVIWRSATGQTWAGSSSADTKDGASHNIYACTLKVGNDFGAAYDGQTILVVKREAGGSGQGVFPIGKGLNQLMMDINNPACTAAPAVAPAYGTCSGASAVSETSVQADMGISDEEPQVFNASFNKASAFAAFSVVDADFNAPPAPIGQVVMGLVVNGQLFNDLQADQVATGLIPAGGVPSITATGFGSLMTSTYDTGLAWGPLFSNGFVGLKNPHINVAFRATGSGTRAAAGLFFNNYPSGKVAKNFATGSTTNTFSGAVDSARSVFNASSSGNVIGAIDGCGATKYCVGILGLEQDITGKDVKFVRVDGNLPSGAPLGRYGVVYESTYQVNKTGLNGAAGRTFADAFGGAMALPVNINSAFAGQGFLALPSKGTGTFASWVAAPESIGRAVAAQLARRSSTRNLYVPPSRGSNPNLDHQRVDVEARTLVHDVSTSAPHTGQPVWRCTTCRARARPLRSKVRMNHRMCTVKESSFMLCWKLRPTKRRKKRNWKSK